MMDINFIERTTLNTDWASWLFIVLLAAVILSKVLSEKRFRDFLNIISSKKFFNRYRDKSNTLIWFDVIITGVRLISYSMFLHIILSFYNITEIYEWIDFVTIFLCLNLFILTKYIIEAIVSFTFDLSIFRYIFSLKKNSYKNLIGITLLPINIILFYNNFSNEYIYYSLIGLFLTVSTLSYLENVQSNLKFISNKFFYFFLYLCTLEIAPYFVIYYLFVQFNTN